MIDKLPECGCVNYEKFAHEEEYPTCNKCGQEYRFERFEPFAYCGCGCCEWGDGRPENPIYVEETDGIRIVAWEVDDTGLICGANDQHQIERWSEAGLPLRSLVYGTVTTQNDVCPKCKGTGSWPFPTRQVCPECHGTLKRKER